jgi:hypothetical protein
MEIHTANVILEQRRFCCLWVSRVPVLFPLFFFVLVEVISATSSEVYALL